MKISDIRTSYERGALTEDEAAIDPFVQFDQWFEQARVGGVPEVNAMTLSTVGSDGRPSSRIVLLKGYETAAAASGASGRGLVWYTNYESRKAEELAVHPFAALQFHWIALERQVRIEGCVEKASSEESDAYFHSRPTGSQIGAWASPQSRVIASREALVERELEMKVRLENAIPRPPFWGGYRLIPDYFEFWQGRPSRLHDRLAYQKDAQGHWSISRLAP